MRATLFQRVKAAFIHPAAREDGWRNFTTGIGTERDKTNQGHFWPSEVLQWNELLAMFNGSDLAAKVVLKVPEEMFRRGYKVKAVGKDDVDDVEALRKIADNDFFTDQMFEDAEVWSDLFGGGLLLMGVDDGQTPDMPLNEDRIRGVDYLHFVDRRFVNANSYYTDPLSAKYGTPETYMITNVVSPGGGIAARPGKNGRISVVHESRCIRFEGQKTDVLTRQQNAGWGFSVLQRAYIQLRKFEHAQDSAFALLADASQAVFKLRGLIDAVAAGQGDKIKARMRMLDEARSAIKAVVIDAGNGDGTSPEEFKREPTPFTGIPDMLKIAMMRLAACFDMPQTELFGSPPEGMNATGDNEVRKWYDKISSRQTRRLGPKLKRWYSILRWHKASPASLKKKDLELAIEFNPLYEPTDLEQAQADSAVATRDVAYITAGVVTAEEVALDRQKLYPSMDVEAREKAKDGGKSFDAYENDPPPELDAPAVGLPAPGNPSITPAVLPTSSK